MQELVLGINRTQDASITVADGERVELAVQKERLTRQRHHWGKMGDMGIYAPYIEDFKKDIRLIVEGYSSDSEIRNIEHYHDELRARFNGRLPSIIQMSHHLSHLYSVFHPSPFDRAAVMVIDYQGTPVRDIDEKWPGKSNESQDALEVSSFYACDGELIECVAKQVSDPGKSEPVGLGFFYQSLSRCLFAGDGQEGKVMGLAPYGDPSALNLPDLTVKAHKVYIPKQWFEVFSNPHRYGFLRSGLGKFSDCANLAAAGQRAFEKALLQLAQWLYSATRLPNLCLAGGCALNCAANDRVRSESPFTDLFIPPAPHDGGTSLGCALYGVKQLTGRRASFRWCSDFLGPVHPLEEFIGQVAGDADLQVDQPSDLINAVVSLLTKGDVVALYRQRSEFGPRALGHRSILSTAQYDVMRHHINQSIKGREWFRPLAPVVRVEDASTVFDLRGIAPFMQYAAVVKPEFQAVIPAATHIDGTARLQTVAADDDPFFHRLLTEFKAISGCGVILNTSFNGKGETIVETPLDCLRCFKATPLNALIVPPYLITKRTQTQHALLR